jgi:hypothetical protein
VPRLWAGAQEESILPGREVLCVNTIGRNRESYCQQLLPDIQRISLQLVRKGFLAFLALVIALQTVGLNCGTAPAQAAIKAPCCGPNCPVPSSTTDRACCQVQTSPQAAEAPSAKPSVSPSQAFALPIQALTIMPAMAQFEQPRDFQNGPPGAARLALLCSRQI